MKVTIDYKYVYGESFINTVRNRVTIGTIEEVSEILKMPFIIIRRQQELMTGEKIDIRLYHSTLNKVDEMEKRFHRIQKQWSYNCEKLKTSIEKYKSMSFWNRLKFLFKGKRWNF